jgi:hypothetical protein
MTSPAALAELTAEITAHDIEFGLPGNPAWCPVARAMRRAVADALGVSTFDVFTIRVLNGRADVATASRDYACDLPDHVSQFIRQFDARLPVSPLRFAARLEPKPRPAGRATS